MSEDLKLIIVIAIFLISEVYCIFRIGKLKKRIKDLESDLNKD